MICEFLIRLRTWLGKYKSNMGKKEKIAQTVIKKHK